MTDETMVWVPRQPTYEQLAEMSKPWCCSVEEMADSWKLLLETVAAADTRPSPSTVTDEGLAERVERLVSSAEKDGRDFIAVFDGPPRTGDLRALLKLASGHTALLREIDFAALAEKCAVACRSEAFPSTATFETRIERVLRAALSRPLAERE